jgi:SAM-dependent methyltransferase
MGTLNLQDIVNRTPDPQPWSEGDNIPWYEPGFSERMLREHLTQEHDLASRRFEIIDRHVDWIHHHLLSARPTRILDLGCGPGLYTSRLARLGHECVGIDYSPASIAYAVEEAEAEGLPCTYVHQDMRAAEYGTGFGLVMLINGELNIFSPADARRILAKAHRALDRGGLLVLEPHTFATVQSLGEAGRSWYSSPAGLFSPRPHLCLQEGIWDVDSRTATIRYFVVDAASSGQVTRHVQSFQAYSEEDYRALLTKSGFGVIKVYPSLTGDAAEAGYPYCVLVGHKQGDGP